MCNRLGGKFILLTLFVLLSISLESRVLAGLETVESNELIEKKQADIDAFSILNRNQAQIEKLEEIVKNLTELVARLETRILNNNKHEGVEKPLGLDDENVETRIEHVSDLGSEKDVEEKGGGAISVTKYDPSWSENFHFVSAVRLNSDATSVDVLPFRDHEGLSKYFVVGDNKGRVYVFLRNGDVAVEFSTLSESPITAILSYFSMHKNDSVLVTGHKNGLVLVHRVWEASSGDEWTSVHMESLGKSTNVPETGEIGSSVDILEAHHVGRTCFILSTDMTGKIIVYKENGDLHGFAIPSNKPIAFLKQRLMFLTETGAGSLDLRTMKIKESECEGLNDSYIEKYVFDATERSKAYGFASDGDLVQVLLLGDVTNFKCRVRSKKKLNIERPISVQAIKGYLIIVNHEKVFVYNVSSHHYVRAVSPRLTFSARLDEIRSSFIKDSLLKESIIHMPLLASDKEKLIILGLGGGYVGMYRSTLPIFKGEYKTMFWSSPVLIFILFLFGAWQFFAKKKEALTSWGPDDPLNTAVVSNGTQLDSTSRNGEAMDLRAGVLRGPSRRYVSPSRYSGASPSSFRPPTHDNNAKPTAVDPNFRASEIKFRGSNVEATNFAKRRDGVFVNSQVVDDSA